MWKLLQGVSLFTITYGRKLSEIHDVRSNIGEHKILELNLASIDQEAREILQSIEIDQLGRFDESVHIKLSPEALEELEKNQISFEDVTEEWIADHERKLDDENHACFEENCHKRSLQDFYSSYQQLPALHARVEDIVSEVDFAVISSIGLSYEGNDQLSVEFGDGDKPLVFYFCNIHAREWLTPHYCTYMVEMLAADGGSPLLDTFDFTIVISANPDGYLYTWSDNTMWRKTRKPNEGSSCVGTDPNRNYDNNHCGAGTSNNPCSEVYCGTEPWSEIEVANIRDYALANAGRIIATNDVHAYGYLWLLPYGAINSNTEDFDTQDKCGQAAIDAIEAISGDSWVQGPIYSAIYPAAGTSVDWFYDTVGVVYAVSAEVRGRSFQPGASEILPSNIEIFAALTAQLTCAAEEMSLDLTPTVAAPTAPPTPVPTCGAFFC